MKRFSHPGKLLRCKKYFHSPLEGNQTSAEGLFLCKRCKFEERRVAWLFGRSPGMWHMGFKPMLHHFSLFQVNAPGRWLFWSEVLLLELFYFVGLVKYSLEQGLEPGSPTFWLSAPNTGLQTLSLTGPMNI